MCLFSTKRLKQGFNYILINSPTKLYKIMLYNVSLCILKLLYRYLQFVINDISITYVINIWFYKLKYINDVYLILFIIWRIRIFSKLLWISRLKTLYYTYKVKSFQKYKLIIYYQISDNPDHSRPAIQNQTLEPSRPLNLFTEKAVSGDSRTNPRVKLKWTFYLNLPSSLCFTRRDIKD